jgi:hypothetical protein
MNPVLFVMIRYCGTTARGVVIVAIATASRLLPADRVCCLLSAFG